MKFPRVCRITMVAAMFFTASLIAETVSLSSLDLKQMTVGWSDAKTDLGVAGKPISIGGKQFTRGAGTHAASNFRVDLEGKATRFTAEVGADDSAGNQGSVEFIVMGDGKVLWQNQNYTFREQYQISREVSSFFEESDPALERLSLDFARTLVSNVLEAY